MKKEIERKIKNLPIKQQMGLYVILSESKNYKKGFSSSEFSEPMKNYFLIKDKEKYGKTIGGILSSLSRNKLIERISGGRNPIWKVKEEIIDNAKEYKKSIFSITTYWPKN